MVYEIIKYPHSSLTAPTRLVNFPLTADIIMHINDMHDTLREEKGGLALASNQIIDPSYRIFVIAKEHPFVKQFNTSVIINPLWKPVDVDKKDVQMEGCLSFPGMSFLVPRYNWIHVKFADEFGTWRDISVRGLAARMVQHECDHLDGRLFIEQLPKKEQIELRNQVIRLKKAGKW